MSAEARRLRRNNILLAIILGIIALMGTLIPYHYLQSLTQAG